MKADDLDLLRQFTREQSQDAFTALVNRHVNLVYSAAVRQVRSPHLAEEVCQSVFTNLARHAATLNPDTVLTAWLYQVTRHAAIDVVRREARRQAREQIAFQMSDMNETSTDWTHIEPLLDEAMDSLDPAERTAILLRYFENKSLREVGDALGASEDAAQKRVSRAVEHLREFFSNRKIAVGAGGLAALISANAIQAAPAGLAATLGASACLASTAVSASAAVTVTKTIAMTTLQKTIIAVVTTGAVVAGVYQTRQASHLRGQVQTLQQQQQQQQAALSNQVQELTQERDRATNALAALSAENDALKKHPNEVLKLRGEVGRLQHEKADIASTSAISKVTANPEARKQMRDMQKTGMGFIYKNLASQLKLTPEQTDKLNDLLADYVMDNVDDVTTVLRDKPGADEMNRIFASEDAALQEKLQALLGPDAAAQYKDYTKNLLATLTVQQFRSKLTGNAAEKAEKSDQLKQAIQQAAQTVLADAGLPPDYQTVPMLNFRNIASEQEGDQSLKLLQDIYQRAAASGSSFLSTNELASFQNFITTGIKNNRAMLSVNRAVMAPISN